MRSFLTGTVDGQVRLRLGAGLDRWTSHAQQTVCMASNFQDEPGGDHFTAGADKARPNVDHALIPDRNNR
jgi:hypothetical protein